MTAPNPPPLTAEELDDIAGRPEVPSSRLPLYKPDIRPGELARLLAMARRALDVEAEIAKEREACAMVCDASVGTWGDDAGNEAARCCADDIRARGKETG